MGCKPIAAVIAATFAFTSSAAEAALHGVMPSSQRVSPAGRQINLGLFPSAMVMSPDGKWLVVTDTGFLVQSLSSVNLNTLVAQNQQVLTGTNTIFQGLALGADGRSGFVSSGGSTDSTASTLLRTFKLNDNGNFTLGAKIAVPGFPIGMASTPDASRLYVVQNLTHTLAVVDPASRSILATIPVGRSPWGVAVHPTRHEAYVSNRGDRTVSIVDTDMNVVRQSVPTGANPNALAVTPDGSKVFVANANSDSVTVFDVLDPTRARTISLQPFPGANFGSSPSAVAISPDGASVYVTLSWENAVGVIDAGTETVRGYIPTGFYPSALVVSPDSRTLYVTTMKGSRTYPRTRTIQPVDLAFNLQLGGTYGVPGTLEIVPVPSAALLHAYTRHVIANNGWNTKVRPSDYPVAAGSCFPIPCSGDDPSPIQHVFFVVRENKTYDQVLGDLPQGNGDPSLTFQVLNPDKTVLYTARDISPNTHALAEEFVLLDRFFANSEKSEPGHAWTMGAIDTDYEERTWVAASFEVRPNDIGSHLSRNTGPSIRGTMYPIATPENGFWFDNCHNHGVSFRNYGEFLRTDNDGHPVDYWMENTNFDFAIFDLHITDASRYEVWKAEFDQQVATNSVPQFNYIALPNDHTNGRTAGFPAPEAYMADNDYALGKLIETISHATEVWKQSMIFVLEDDPQSGGDHVDSHRTVALVIGPYVRRHAVNHTRYDMASMHRTMELILDLPPMSLFDQMAIVMRDVFTDTPDFTPYSALPQNIPISINPVGTSGDELSRRYDFSRPDRVPDAVMNKVLWEYFHRLERKPR